MVLTNDNNLVRRIFLVAILSICSSETYSHATADESWQDRLPVSLNEKLPEDLPQDFHKRYWHSLRLHPIAGKQFEVKQLVEQKLFHSRQGEDLKNAIVKADVPKIKELIEKGVDANEKGVGGLTPLFIAMFVDTDPRPFELLLAQKADPNILLGECDIAPFANFRRFSVSHLAAMPKYNRLFKQVFEKAGDPNIKGGPRGDFDPPFALAAFDQPDSLKRLQILASKGADFNQEYVYCCKLFLPNHLIEAYWADKAELRERHYAAALFAVEHGAEYTNDFLVPESCKGRTTPYSGCYFEPIHFLAMASLGDKSVSENSRAPALNKLFEVFGKNGQTLEKSKQDLERWKRWKQEGLQKLITIEHEKRKADKSGTTLKRWQEKGLQEDKALLKKKAEQRRNNPKERIKRLPVSLNGDIQIYQWQDHFWSDIVKSELIHRFLIEKWKEIKIFDDPDVESLKLAMFAKDVNEMKRLIVDEKVDVNTLGRDKLTLLYLSLGIDGDPRPFELLLESGANPNIINEAEHEQKFLAVVHVIARSNYCRHFKTVFEKGGDANLLALRKNPIGYIPLDCIDWVERVGFLCERGALIKHADEFTSVAETLAIDWIQERKLRPSREIQILTALKLGASFDFEVLHVLAAPKLAVEGQKKRFGRCWLRMPHLLLESDWAKFNSKHSPLKKWLEAKGISFAGAQTDLDRWRSWIADGTPELIEKEHSERISKARKPSQE